MTSVVLLGQVATTSSATSITLSNVNWLSGDTLYLLYLSRNQSGISFFDTNGGTWVSGNNPNQVDNTITAIGFTDGSGCFGRMISVRSDAGSNETVTMSVGAGNAMGFQLWRVRPSSSTVTPGSLAEVSSKDQSSSFSVTSSNVKINSIVLASSFLKSNTTITDTDTTRGSWGSPTTTSITNTNNNASISTQLKTVTAAGDQTYNASFTSQTWGALIIEIPVPNLPHWGVAI